MGYTVVTNFDVGQIPETSQPATFHDDATYVFDHLSSDVIPALNTNFDLLNTAFDGADTVLAGLANKVNVSDISDVADLSDTTDGNDDKLASRGVINAAIRAGQKPSFILEDQKATGTDGGSAVAGAWTKATLAEELDTLGIVSVTSDEFTVTDDCYVEWEKVFYKTNKTTTRIWDVTNGVEVRPSQSRYFNNSTSVDGSSTGWAVLTAGNTYRLEYYAQTAVTTNGLGSAGGQSSFELYATLKGYVL